MALLSLRNVSVSYGGPAVLDEVSFSVEPGDRACVTGRNGEGKSTLLKIIAGTIQPDTGEIIRQPGLRTAFLTQDVPRDTDGTVTDIVARGLSHEARDTTPGPALFHPTRAGREACSIRAPAACAVVLLARAGRRLTCCCSTAHPIWTSQPSVAGGLSAQGHCACLFVTHDRAFLKRVAVKV